eukprot:TRINITY_DN1029_c0_g1_i8.p1 TRINITY_DN1029_c0_g1~~TRINITY_DN1029_c0_g1_i8.p1  ORF type:complete len:397 (-),score=45.47 TRINITY_DN1029_c0_g1_i8:83-1273(-)
MHSRLKTFKKVLIRNLSILISRALAEIEEGKGTGLNNITEHVQRAICKDLHLQKGHPINTVKTQIESFFNLMWCKDSVRRMDTFENLSPVMSSEQAFDELLYAMNHQARKPTNIYYVSPEVVLRPHTSAHQIELIQAGHLSFLCTGDVYRRNQVNQTNYPVFHQMEGVHLFDEGVLEAKGDDTQQVAFITEDVKKLLETLVGSVLGHIEMRWSTVSFPYAEPAFQLQTLFKSQWIDILSCGVINPEILKNCNQSTKKGWSFAIFLDRWAMILFGIPDIRLFWTSDPRFHRQFQDGKVSRFLPYSKYPPCFKEMAFWIPDDFDFNAFHELVREIAGEFVEEVKLMDQFIHPMTDKKSLSWRINYRNMGKSLTPEEVNKLHQNVKAALAERFDVELRS